MPLSTNNAKVLLLELNKKIEEYAEETVKNIIEDKKLDFLVYPPNGGLTDAEQAEIVRLSHNENFKNALRKILADNAAGVVFNLLNLLDGTIAPENDDDEWTGIKLVDEEEDEDREVFGDTLHDALFEAYWDWKKYVLTRPGN